VRFHAITWFLYFFFEPRRQACPFSTFCFLATVAGGIPYLSDAGGIQYLSVAGGIPCLSRHWTDNAFVLLKLPTLSHRTQPKSPPAFSPTDSSMSLPTEPATQAAGRPQQHNGPVALVHSNTTGPWPSVGGDERGRHTEAQPPVRRHTGRRGERPRACGWSASKRLRVVGVQAPAGCGRPSA